MQLERKVRSWGSPKRSNFAREDKRKVDFRFIPAPCGGACTKNFNLQSAIFNLQSSLSTNIQWTDLTDNIIRAKDGGWWCQKISQGCKNCYSEKLNQNTFFGGNKQPYSGQPPELTLDTEAIHKWGFQRKPKKHFVASMTDVFGEWVPRFWQHEMLDGMFVAPKQAE